MVEVEDIYSTPAVRFLGLGVGFCHTFGSIGVIIFGLAMLMDPIYMIAFVSK